MGEFVELPENCSNLKYANILAGAIRYVILFIALYVSLSIFHCMLSLGRTLHPIVQCCGVQKHLAGFDSSYLSQNVFSYEIYHYMINTLRQNYQN